METKICTKCKEEKEIGDFYIRRSRNNQPKSICKKCESLRFAKPIKIIPDLEGEIWKDVVGFEGIYIVSNKERVRRIMHRTHPTNKLMTNTLTPSGYVCVSLTANGKGKYSLLHIVVAKAFIPNPLNLPEVNHIDGNKANNKAENLEWNTSLENIQHAWKTGLSTPKKGESHSQSVLTEKDVLEIRAIKGMTKRDIGKLYNIGEAMVGKIIHRHRWTHI